VAAACAAGVAAAAFGSLGLADVAEPGKRSEGACAPEVIRALAADPLWPGAPVVVSFSAARWPYALALVVQLERQGHPVWVEAREAAFMVPADLVSDRWADGRPVIRVHVHRPTGRKEGALYADGRAEFRRVWPRYALGTTLRPGEPEAQGHLLEGWSNLRFRLASGARGRCLRDSAARLALELDRPATAPLTLAVEGSPIKPNDQPDVRIEVVVNGEPVARWRLRRYDPPREDAVKDFLREAGEFRAAVPPEVINRQNPVIVEFKVLEGLPEGYRRLPTELPRFGLLVTGVRLGGRPTAKGE
jgi:hypothetical protein